MLHCFIRYSSVTCISIGANSHNFIDHSLLHSFSFIASSVKYMMFIQGIGFRPHQNILS